MAIRAPYLPYDELRLRAEDFLGNHNPEGSTPVPIEEIVEFEFGIDIVPMPGLHQAFEIDSFITQDLTEIRVDEFVYASRPRRYRFSLAHELAHRVLHGDVFAQLQFKDVTAWKAAIATAIPPKEYSYFEFHANAFAGLVLVPQDNLKREFSQAVARVKVHGFDLVADFDAVKEAVENYLAEFFLVSTAVIQRRVEYDRLWNDVK